nr:SEC-C domain-containing protein [Bacteroidota bacterium]
QERKAHLERRKKREEELDKLAEDFYLSQNVELNMNHEDLYEVENVKPVETYKRECPKVGRNKPCPCGSGKKYKKCCLKK